MCRGWVEGNQHFGGKYLFCLQVFKTTIDIYDVFYLHLAQNVVRVIKSIRKRWTGHVARKATIRNICEIVFRKFEAKRPLEKSRHRCKDNTKLDLRKIGYTVMNLIQLAQNRVKWAGFLHTEMNLPVP